MLTASINGKHIAYTEDTMFLVQVGKGAKGKYSIKYAFKGDLGRALMYYNCVNIGNGYKKRLYVPSLNKPLLARQTSG